MFGEAPIAGREIDKREGEVFAFALMRLVLVSEALHRPVAIRLRIALEARTATPNPARPRDRSVNAGNARASIAAAAVR